MKRSVSNLLSKGIKTLLVFLFVVSLNSCQENVEPSNSGKKIDSSLGTVDPKSERDKPTNP